MGHLVRRFEEGETQHKDLILAYALHEQRLQVLSFDDPSENPEHSKSLGRLLFRRTRGAQISRRRYSIPRCLGETSKCTSFAQAQLKIGWSGNSGLDIVAVCPASSTINVR